MQESQPQKILKQEVISSNSFKEQKGITSHSAYSGAKFSPFILVVLKQIFMGSIVGSFP